MSDLVKRVADDIYHRYSTDTYVIARVAIKAVLDDMRDYFKEYNLIAPENIDAYEKDKLK